MTNQTNCFGFNDPRFVNVAIAGAIASCISFLACLLAITVIVLFKKWQTFGQRLLIYFILPVTFASVALGIRKLDLSLIHI